MENFSFSAESIDITQNLSSHFLKFAQTLLLHSENDYYFHWLKCLLLFIKHLLFIMEVELKNVDWETIHIGIKSNIQRKPHTHTHPPNIIL